MAEVKFIVERPDEAYEFPKTQRAEPCVMVLFGASGDLAKRKILPAIYNLARDGFLPDNFALVGSSRSLESADVFRRHVRESIARFSRTEFDEGLWDELSGRIFHVRGDPREAGTQQEIRGRIGELDREFGTQGNAMFHVATPPSSMYAIVEQLGANELLERRGGQGAMPWPRVLVEKPFGLDLESARQLNDLLARKLEESQIFRVDHFLAKETVQNIMVFRFGNAVFEPIWNSKYVDHVQITAAETLGMEGRGAFYEEVGVLRDVVQNHLLQVLALCAMEAPVSAVPEAVREEKTKVFRALRLMRGDAAERDAVLGQYRGYREEKGVGRDSRVPTFAALKVLVDNWRWQGVPFYIRAGKKLKAGLTEVRVQFQAIPFCLFGSLCPMIPRNELTLRISPDEGISLRFVSKEPGEDYRVSGVTMDFNYSEFQKRQPEAYERLLLDCMRGDQTLFARKDAAELEWRFTDPIVSAWERGLNEVHEYEPGSSGPKQAEDLLARDGRAWRAI